MSGPQDREVAGDAGAAHVLTVGETMLLVGSTRPEPLQHSTRMSLGIGGAESNVAIGLHRLGTAVTWVGRVGDDSAGDLVERTLRGEGVRAVCVHDADAPTGLMLKERRSTVATHVWYYRAGSAGSRLAPGDVPDAALRGASLVHLTGITPALSTSARRLVLDLVERAVQLGVPLSFDLNYRSALWTRAQARALYAEVVPRCDVVFAGEDEAAILVGPSTDAVTSAERVRALGARTVVVKRGADGAVCVGPEGTSSRPAVPVDVRDTVGAGDAFVAGYLAEHLRGECQDAALATATAVGAYACTGDGDWESLPRRRDLALLTSAEPVTR
ncbi:2-dehydro-3-deoxygluconokinase [Sediminihabitans luteus]|uniref:2-dehydro-3-deoxygluconokinase n=1 Tax=Sediminihabitans luteus TaxID=1138585 RepID=A0A2M9D177_9CELL|nr:sugar kinase [Sediminihabitans luteus]PJJ77964.1 2-dehydro-3-deoxygluconokinase [Sediminihabitans luteus]GIJ00593.1 sugar kinase [Sediminihabitans luteus]